MQIGNPPQNVRVLPSTTWPWTAVPAIGGCPPYGPTGCSDTTRSNTRGGIFDSSKSLTYTPQSRFSLYSEEYLGYNIEGDLGFDDVMLGLQGSGAPQASHSLMAGMQNWNLIWVGILGLNSRPVKFTDTNSPQPSLIQLLNDTGKIPSVSWGYTAGAPYRKLCISILKMIY